MLLWGLIIFPKSGARTSTFLYSTIAKEVGILVKQGLQFRALDTFCDGEGRYVDVQNLLGLAHITLINI